VLLIGAGDTIELAARHLADKQARRLIVANRTLENAQELAGRYGGYAIALADLPQHLAEADIVISSTAARQPVLTRSHGRKGDGDAPAQADVHGRHRGAARHRASVGELPTYTCTASTTCAR
jgi:hypothetical protein